jgi:hypothetical protein
MTIERSDCPKSYQINPYLSFFKIEFSEICGSRSCKDVEYGLVGCDAV